MIFLIKMKYIFLLILWLYPLFSLSSGDVQYNNVLLEYELLEPGDTVALNSVISVLPTKNEEGFLNIEFERNNVTEKFLEDVFYKPNKNINHTFTKNGFEAILTDCKFILRIYTKITFHLRDDIEGHPSYKTFKDKNVKGIVTKVSGTIKYSSNHEKIEKFHKDIFVTYNMSFLSSVPNVKMLAISAIPNIKSIPNIKIIEKRDVLPMIFIPIKNSRPKKHKPKIISSITCNPPEK